MISPIHSALPVPRLRQEEEEEEAKKVVLLSLYERLIYKTLDDGVCGPQQPISRSSKSCELG